MAAPAAASGATRGGGPPVVDVTAASVIADSPLIAAAPILHPAACGGKYASSVTADVCIEEPDPLNPPMVFGKLSHLTNRLENHSPGAPAKAVAKADPGRSLAAESTSGIVPHRHRIGFHLLYNHLASCAASWRARAKTASNIASVSTPVKVFCWLGWYEHKSVRPPGSVLGQVAELRRGRRPSRPATLWHAYSPSATMTLRSSRSSSSRDRYGRAGCPFARVGLVGRRRTVHRCCDVRIVEGQAVVTPRAGGLGGKSSPVQSGGGPVPRAVSGEHAPRPVCPVGRRRQPDDGHTGPDVAEAGHGTPPVRLAGERGPGAAATCFARLHQTWTGRHPTTSCCTARSDSASSIRLHRAEHTMAPVPASAHSSSSRHPAAGPSTDPGPDGPARGDSHHRQDVARRAGGLHLAEKGRAQALVVAARIAAMEKPPTAIYASPLERTRETAAPIASALGLRVRTARGLIEADVGTGPRNLSPALSKTKEWSTVHRWPGGFRFPGGESFADMSARTCRRGGAGRRPPGPDHCGGVARRSDQGHHGGRPGVPLDLMPRLVISPCSVSALLFTGRRTRRSVRELDRLPRRVGAVVTDGADFDAPDHCTVGVIGEVGHRLFLFYSAKGSPRRQSRSRSSRSSVLAGYLGRIVKELGRPGHLPDDLSFTAPRTPSGWSGPSASPTTRRSTAWSWCSRRSATTRRTRRRRAAMCCGLPSARAGGGLRHPRHPSGGGRASPLPALWPPPGPIGSRLSATNGHRPPVT